MLAERQAAAEASGEEGAILVAAGLRPELASALVPPSHGHEAADGESGEPFHVKHVALGNRSHLQPCTFQSAMPRPLDTPCSQSGCLMSRLQVLLGVQATGRGRNRSCMLGLCCWPTCWSWSLVRLREPGYHRLFMTPTGNASSTTNRELVPIVTNKQRSRLQPWSMKPLL